MKSAEALTGGGSGENAPAGVMSGMPTWVWRWITSRPVVPHEAGAAEHARVAALGRWVLAFVKP
ncbi:MAG: hypothetical protein ROY82_12770 [Truepera sp.]|nr:hypothetical protein [Truepera sp.]